MITSLDQLYQANQEKRDQHPNEALKYMDSEEQLAAHLHEIQGVTAYPDHLESCVAEGLVEAVLSVLQHPNLDICQLCVTLLYELCEAELAQSHPETVKKVITRYQDNSIWSLLQKNITQARKEKLSRKLQSVSERTEEDILEQKSLAILQNMLDIQAEIVAAKLMHADTFIEYLMESLQPKANSKISYSQVLCSDILTSVVQNCGTAFRSKFVITLQGVVKLLTLVDGLLESGDELVDTELEVVQNMLDAISMLLVDDSIKENAAVF